MIVLAKKVDPRLDRSIFVFTKFGDQLKNFTSTRDLNRYLTSTVASDSTSFFVSLIPGIQCLFSSSHKTAKDRARYVTKESFKDQLDQLIKEDLVVLEQLQYDRRFLSFSYDS